MFKSQEKPVRHLENKKDSHVLGADVWGRRRSGPQYVMRRRLR